MKYLPQMVMALALTGMTAAVFAADTTGDPPPGAPGPHRMLWRRPAEPLISGILLRALRDLNLSDQQQQQVRTILQNARTQLRSERQSNPPDITVLGNPGDPNYNAAITQLETLASQRVQQASETEQQIYGVLTDQQKAQLPQVLANLKARRQQHADGNGGGQTR